MQKCEDGEFEFNIWYFGRIEMFGAILKYSHEEGRLKTLWHFFVLWQNWTARPWKSVTKGDGGQINTHLVT